MESPTKMKKQSGRTNNQRSSLRLQSTSSQSELNIAWAEEFKTDAEGSRPISNSKIPNITEDVAGEDDAEVVAGSDQNIKNDDSPPEEVAPTMIDVATNRNLMSSR